MSMFDTKVVHMWSGPRSLSTAIMYSFAQREDTTVLDEPLYASWLLRNPDIFRPYREEFLSKSEVDCNRVMKHIAEYRQKPILFCKHIAKQFRGVDKTLLYHPNAIHVFLVRNPLEMIQGWDRRSDVHKEGSSMEGLCLNIMCEMYADIRSHTGKEPIVFDADLLIANPPHILSQLCRAIGIEYMEKQLSWPAGPKPYDGMWAAHWYGSVHTSTSFSSEAAVMKYPVYNADQLRMYQELLPFYQFFLPKALGYNVLSPHSSCPPNTHSQTEVIDHGLVVSSKLGDVRNKDILAWIGDSLMPRYLARVSAFDSAVQGGDAVWEGLRVYNGKVFKLEEHLDRLFDSAKSMAFANVPPRDYIKQAVFRTLAANNMSHNVHMRLTLTRGVKVTSSMNPAFNCYGCTLIILPEFKVIGDQTTYDNTTGIALITATNRRNPAQCVDSKIHHCNLINNSKCLSQRIFYVYECI
ncbi:hypothetical protein EON65_35550 [archaeon]|nr:MAG: hypothetical protein EON65_35550 [archaeon]